MSRGILVLAQNSDIANYVQQAELLAMSKQASTIKLLHRFGSQGSL